MQTCYHGNVSTIAVPHQNRHLKVLINFSLLLRFVAVKIPRFTKNNALTRKNLPPLGCGGVFNPRPASGERIGPFASGNGGMMVGHMGRGPQVHAVDRNAELDGDVIGVETLHGGVHIVGYHRQIIATCIAQVHYQNSVFYLAS